MTTITIPTTTTDSSTPTTSATAAAGTGFGSWPVWCVGAVTGVLATAVVVAIVAVARAAGVPMEAGPVYEPAGTLIPMEGFVSITLFATAIGTVLAMALARWSKRPVTIFLAVTVVLTLVSFAAPHTTHYATAATRIVLDLTHVVAALIVIPALAYRLAQVRRAH